MTAFEGPRRRLIEALREQGIGDLAVLRAFDLVPRHLFVPEALRHQAYRDVALPIGRGQTISRPWTHALALQALDLGGRERVLEIGAGSGFQTALLAQLAGHVYTIERVPELAARARATLAERGICNVAVRVGDGTTGWAEHAPFDAIVVSARADEIASAWLDQLAPEGRLVVPFGPPEAQELVRIRRDRQGRLQRRSLGAAQFVPLIQRRDRGDRG